MRRCYVFLQLHRNRVGGGYAPLCQTVLRDEWGFRGMVLTDYFGVYGYMNSDQGIRNGTDCMLVAYDTETNHREGSGEARQAFRHCAKHARTSCTR